MKPGDKVKLIANSTGSVNEVGDIGIVEFVVEQLVKVNVEHRPNFGNLSAKKDLEIIND